MSFTMYGIKFVFIVLIVQHAFSQEMQVEDYFRSCKRGQPNFDICLRDAINDVRPFFKEGLPKYKVGSFDPFHADEVRQSRNFLGISYNLILTNVSESGWTSSKITDLVTEFDKYKMHLTHYFPDKRLQGHYQFEGNVWGNKMKLEGDWTLALFDYVQKMTVSRVPRSENGILVYDTPIKVDVKVQTCQKLELHISDLLRGRRFLENMLDRIINTAWPPGFYLLRPIINDLVNTAFSKIFDDYFHDFPFNVLIN